MCLNLLEPMLGVGGYIWDIIQAKDCAYWECEPGATFYRKMRAAVAEYLELEDTDRVWLEAELLLDEGAQAWAALLKVAK